MAKVEAKLESMGLALPEPVKVPPGIVLPFPFVSIRGDRVLISGHGPQETDGTLAGPSARSVPRFRWRRPTGWPARPRCRCSAA